MVQTSNEPPPAPEQGPRRWHRELPVLVGVALLLALLIKTFVLQVFFIPSGSMERTLHGCPGCHGDRVLVNKLVYDVRDIHRGEIVVFKAPESWGAEVPGGGGGNVLSRALRAIGRPLGFVAPDEQDFIKRVIGVGGDVVACCDRSGRVTVNGVGLDETYVFENDQQRFGPVTVPKGRLWVMGDHRGESADSRAHQEDRIGTVSTDDVIGRAFFIIWPPNRIGPLRVPEPFVAAGVVGAPVLAGAFMLAACGRTRRAARRTLPS
jgi:signal peptidase I